MHDQRKKPREPIDAAAQQAEAAAQATLGARYASVLQQRRAHVHTHAALAATEQLLRDVPEAYTIYNYRRELLLSLLLSPQALSSSSSSMGSKGSNTSAADGDDATATKHDNNDNNEEAATPQCVTALVDELALNTTLLQRNYKNYAAFAHRHWIIGQLQRLAHNDDDGGSSGSEAPPRCLVVAAAAAAALRRVLVAEVAQCNALLRLDERNFHAWNYRRWAQQQQQQHQQQQQQSRRTTAAAAESAATLCDFATDEKAELAFTRACIARNFSNYSAWHQRATVLRAALQRWCARGVVAENDSDSKGDQRDDTTANVLTTTVTVAVCGAAFAAVLQRHVWREASLIVQAMYCDPNDQAAYFYASFVLDVFVQHYASLQQQQQHQPCATVSGTLDKAANDGDDDDTLARWRRSAAAGEKGTLPDVMDVLVTAALELLADERHAGNDECYLPAYFVLDILQRLTRQLSPTVPCTSSPSLSRVHDGASIDDDDRSSSSMDAAVKLRAYAALLHRCTRDVRAADDKDDDNGDAAAVATSPLREVGVTYAHVHAALHALYEHLVRADHMRAGLYAQMLHTVTTAYAHMLSDKP